MLGMIWCTSINHSIHALFIISLFNVIKLIQDVEGVELCGTLKNLLTQQHISSTI